MTKKTLTVMTLIISVSLLLFDFVGDFEVLDKDDGVAYAEVVEPHCSDGDCSDYALWCVSQGRIAMCLNAFTDQEVTVCIGAKAMPELMNHFPNACIGTCYYVHQDGAVCNFDADWGL